MFIEEFNTISIKEKAFKIRHQTEKPLKTGIETDIVSRVSIYKVRQTQTTSVLDIQDFETF